MTFTDYLISEARAAANYRKPIDPIIAMCRVLNWWLSKHRSTILKRVEHESEERHKNQIRVHVEVCTLDPDKEMSRLNGVLLRSIRCIDSISEDKSDSGSYNYKTWTLKLRTLDSIQRDPQAITSVTAIFENVFGVLGAPVQMKNLLSSPAREFSLVYTIPTKGRKKDTNKPLLKPKDFVPQEFGITGDPYTLDGLLDTVRKKFAESRLPRYALFSGYVSEAVSKSIGMESGIPVADSALPVSSIASKDVDIINKNFGEVLCAFSLLSDAPSGAKVKYPGGSNAEVYDFTLYTADGDDGVLYSVKNKRGSKGTAISSLKEMLSFYERTHEGRQAIVYPWFRKLMLELADKSGKDKHTQHRLVQAAIKMAERSRGGSCAKVLNYVDEALAVFNLRPVFLGGFESIKEALDLARKIEGSHEDKKRKQYRDFVSILREMTAKCIQLPNKSSDKIEELIHDGMYGVVVYPVGKCLCNDLNADDAMIKCLNLVLNAQNSIVQINTQVSISGGKLNVGKPKTVEFQKANFRFDYNGYRNNTGTNRPLGYKIRSGQ